MPARRGHGEGSITLRKDGRHMAKLRYEDPLTGEHKRLSVYGKTRAEARTKLRDAIRRLESGDPATDSSATFAKYCASWMAGPLEHSDRRLATKNWYRTMLNRHAIPALGNLRMDQMRPAHVERLMNKMREDGLSVSSIRGVRTVVAAVFTTAVRDGVVAKSPVTIVRRPKLADTTVETLEPPQVARLLEVSHDHRLGGLVALMAYTGMRRGEALALRWSDMNLTGSKATVRGSLSRVDGDLVRGATKTGKTRTVTLAGPLVGILKDHRRRQAEERLALGAAWPAGDWVFTSEAGTPVEPRNVNRLLRRFGAKAGIDGLHPHQLRHTWATVALTQGVPVHVVSDALGHASPNVTWSTYAHLLEGSSRSAVDVVTAAFGDTRSDTQPVAESS